MKNKINVQLLLGGVLLGIILIVIVFPRLFTENNPYGLDFFRTTYIDGKLSIDPAPYEPSEDFPLGSDDKGRDVLSMIVYGTRLTILLGFLAAVGRFVISLPLAINAGFGNQVSKSVIKQFTTIFSAIPALLISIIILRLNFFTGLEKASSILAFTLVLSFVGWPKLASVITERVEEINAQSFIRSEIAIGKKRRKIALENVIPHLAPELIVLFFMEIARTLSMIMQLGVFSLYVGNLHVIKSTDFGNIVYYDMSFEPEWASLLSSSRNLVNAAPWVIIFPALAFFISVLAFNMFGEGLRKTMQSKDSKVIPSFRKLISLNFKGFFKGLNKQTWIKLGISAVLIAVIAFTAIAMKTSNFDFEQNIDEIAKYDQVIIGTPEAQDCAQMIEQRMIELGIEPLKGEYIHSYETSPHCIITDQSFIIDSYENQPELGVDYAFNMAETLSVSGKLYDATKEDLYNIDDYNVFTDKFILIDGNYYSNTAITAVTNDIQSHTTISGILKIKTQDEDLDNFIVKHNSSILSLLVSQDFAKTLIQNSDKYITISAETTELGSTGNNIIGIYKNDEFEINQEAVLIGMNYNYTSPQGMEMLSFNLQVMKNFCSLDDNKRSIIFMFLDGTIEENTHGIYHMSQNYPYSSGKTEVYLDLTGLTASNFDSLIYSKDQAPVTRPMSWFIGYQTQKELDSAGIETKNLDSVLVGREYFYTDSYADNAMFWDKGIATVIVESGEVGNRKHDIYELGSIIMDIVTKNIY